MSHAKSVFETSQGLGLRCEFYETSLIFETSNVVNDLKRAHSI